MLIDVNEVQFLNAHTFMFFILDVISFVSPIYLFTPFCISNDFMVVRFVNPANENSPICVILLLISIVFILFLYVAQGAPK